MGRKIPGKKHRGVKDPVAQNAIRSAGLRTKINAPPRNPENQEIPKSLERIMDLTRKVKNGTISTKRKRIRRKQGVITSAPAYPHLAQTPVPKTHKGRPEKSVPVFTQNPNENSRAFLQRVNRIVHSVIKETDFEQKFGVDIKKDPETGQVVKIVKAPEDELDVLMKQARSKGNTPKKKQKKQNKTEERLTKDQKRKLKLRQRTERKEQSKKDDFSKFKDTVKFGEVVHGPPTLKVPKKTLQHANEAHRPGTKGLLLKSLIKLPQKRTAALDKDLPDGGTVKSTNKKKKLVDVSIITKEEREKQRESAVQAYRAMKAKMLKTFR